MSKLTARKVETAKCEPGQRKRKLADGQGLHLIVSPNGQRDWFFIFTWHEPGSDKPRRPEMNLGRFPDVSLAEARTLAAEARRLIREGINPIERRKAGKMQNLTPTFGVIADQLFESKSAEWRSDIHREQWASSLKKLAAPLRDIPVNEVTTERVLEVLTPIWQRTPETASRVRGRIEAVLDAAKAKGLRSGENCARWRGHLSHVLPKRSKLSRGHYPSMPYDQIPGFMAKLRADDTISSKAVQFAILTAARPGEVMGATWAEIDLSVGLWVIPPARMKGAREHRVPLTAACVKLLSELHDHRMGSFVFPSPRGRDNPLTYTALRRALERIGADDITAHGFRSTFRTWAAEETNFPSEIAEQCLAHLVGSEVERAYRRGDALEKRRALMEQWSAFLDQRPAENVVRLDRTIGGAA